MGLPSGVAGSLGPVLSAGPSSQADLPPYSWGRAFTSWELDPVLTVVIVWLGGLYVFGVWVLRDRGDRWPLGRTLAFVGAGLGTFFVATSSGLGRYDTTLLSVHMVQHMLLSMVVPLFLALGAPVTLLLRTLPRRPRGWLNRLLHSRLARVLSFAPLTFLLFVLSPWLLYYTGWYDASLRSETVHVLMHLHLVTVGALFFWPLVGVDPVPGRVAFPFRFLLLVLTLPFHAFLGVSIMSQEELIGGAWYRALPMSWLPDPAVDQHVAGGILWGSGDAVGIIFLAVLFVQWVRSSMREAVREDRRLDRLEEQEARRGTAAASTGSGTGDPAA